MRTLETTAIVAADRTITLKLPDDVPEGKVDLVVVMSSEPSRSPRIDWATWTAHDLQLADPNATFRREDIYGDDGR
jgi:hypothetical protein